MLTTCVTVGDGPRITWKPGVGCLWVPFQDDPMHTPERDHFMNVPEQQQGNRDVCRAGYTSSLVDSTGASAQISCVEQVDYLREPSNLFAQLFMAVSHRLQMFRLQLQPWRLLTLHC